MHILTLSCWSESIHFRVFRLKDFSLSALGSVERIGIGDSFITYIVPGRNKFILPAGYCNQKGAIALILATLTNTQNGALASLHDIAAVGHRVVHGGEYFRQSSLIDARTLAAIRKLDHLAPLHNNHNLGGIEAAQQLLPDIPHAAIFDTAFHQTMPGYAYIYPLPYEWYEQYAVRRYGFHGPSHLYLSRRAAVLLGKPPSECNLITIYMDRGVSLCAIRQGISIDTSMGMTPLEGAVMDTRCGDIDAGIIPFEMQRNNLSAREINIVLNQKSGIFGITGQAHHHEDLVQASWDGDERCTLALQIEAYRLRKYIGAYIATVGPLDGLVFSLGSGDEDWFVRQLTLEGMECFGLELDREKNRTLALSGVESVVSAVASAIKIFVIPNNEQLVFAEDVAAILAGVAISPANDEYTFSHPGFVPNICTEDRDLIP